MLGEHVLYLSVRELGERLRTRKLSPVELTEAYLERSRTLGPKLSAYATLTPDLAMGQARAAEREIAAGKYRGPLHGVPYAAKDLLAVRGYPTTWGARPYAEQKFDYDATVIQRLHDAGAVLLGKAAMIELAGGMGYRYASASITGAARNPWNTGCWTCGSSSGSGAIVAGALAAFAIGTETWGSIVCPAAFNGISGLRPTYGRVSRHGAMALCFSMDKIGPMARSTEDCALVLHAISGHDAADAASLPAAAYRYAPATAQRKLRVGWLTNAWKKINPAVEARMKAAAATLGKIGMKVEETQLPDGPWEAAAGLVISVEGAAAFSKLIESGRIGELTDPAGKIGGYVNQMYSADDFLRAMRVRAVLQRQMAKLFERFDVLATASLPITATKVEANLDDEVSFSDPLGGIGNFCGLPALSVPCGLTDDGKLPVGLQFVSSAMDDDAVVAAGLQFQQHTEWHRMRPPL